ncbi:MAG: porin family protein [Acidobacteriales bacterium]|nr:porin family protein [Terriglobales bacterium]
MRKLVMISVVLFGFTAVGVAQDTVPAFDIFGGYSYLNTEDVVPAPFSVDLSGHGWDLAGTAHLNNWFGVTADLSGYYTDVFVGGANVDVSAHNFLFGPTVSYRTSKYTPFAHSLFGASRASVDLGFLAPFGFSATDTAFAMALGGGVDWHLNERWSVRPVQLDYLMTRFASDTQNNLRFSIGVVVRFGSR